MRAVLIFLLAVPLGAEEPARFGAALKFAIPFPGWFQNVDGRNSAADRSQPWMVGPAVELRLTDRVAAEVSGLYRQVGRDDAGGYSFYPFSDRERGYAWEFPVVAKYRLPFWLKGMRPFAAAGWSVHWQRTHTDSYFTVTLPDTNPPQFAPRASKSARGEALTGFTAGAGLEPRLGRARLIIEGRYNRWVSGRPNCPDSTYLRCVAPNQGSLLLGLGF